MIELVQLLIKICIGVVFSWISSEQLVAGQVFFENGEDTISSEAYTTSSTIKRSVKNCVGVCVGVTHIDCIYRFNWINRLNIIFNWLSICLHWWKMYRRLVIQSEAPKEYSVRSYVQLRVFFVISGVLHNELCEFNEQQQQSFIPSCFGWVWTERQGYSQTGRSRLLLLVKESAREQINALQATQWNNNIAFNNGFFLYVKLNVWENPLILNGVVCT